MLPGVGDKHIIFKFDFMFELKKSELEDLRSQIAASTWGGTRTGSSISANQRFLNSERG